jgi:hypothetical protein
MTYDNEGANMQTQMRQRFGRTFSVLLGAGLWGLLLDPMAGAISLSYADSAQPPSANAKINRALPGVQTGMLQEWKGDKLKINGISYMVAPGLIFETTSGDRLPTLGGLQLRYPVQVQYWVDGDVITQMILSTVPTGK